MNRRIYLIPALLSIVIFAVSVYRGTLFLEKRPTDPVSEGLIVREAGSIVAGKHSYGIVDYTHYPNGPTYMILLPLKLKMSTVRSLRVVPLYISALGIAVLFYGLTARVRSLPIIGITFAACLSLLWQPSVVEWMGALYGHGYHTAFIFAGIGLSLIPGLSPWVLGILGFISGWFQYDMIFCFVFSIFMCRWFLRSGKGTSIWRQARKAVIDSTIVCVGIFLAIIAHLIQNALALGGIREAFNDLIGSAAARAGMQVAEQLNPEYLKSLGREGVGSRAPVRKLTKDLHESFITDSWSNPELAVYMFAAVALLVVIGLAMRWRSFSIAASGRLLVTLIVVGCASIAAGVSWYIAMPNHTVYHFHFIQRHFLFSYCLAWVALQRLCVALFEAPLLTAQVVADRRYEQPELGIDVEGEFQSLPDAPQIVTTDGAHL
ncbi:MAG: hypothetical protein ACK5Y6_01635 [Pseudomonadota bacterium]|jgi:hypothetical protein